jgi:hypothetical protein
VLAADQKKERAERKERLKGTLGSNLGDPPRSELAIQVQSFEDSELAFR